MITEPTLDEICVILRDILHEYHQWTLTLFIHPAQHPLLGFFNVVRLWFSYRDVAYLAATEFMFYPQHFVTVMQDYAADYIKLSQQIIQQLVGGDIADVIEPDSHDRRFKYPAWREHAGFNFMKQSYLLNAHHSQAIVDSYTSLNELQQQQLAFGTRLFLETFAPTNFLASNPEIQQLTAETHGLNLLKGYRYLMQDVNLWRGYININKVPADTFVLGETIAATPGTVVFQNEIMQLIEYSPTTADVYQTPLLIITSWINKYYILDLRPQNSLIKWTIAEGHRVFVISWINPQETAAPKNFTDYLLAGPVTALEKITAFTGEKKINTLGFCLGGTLLAATAAYLQAKNDQRINSTTYLASLIDFADPGDFVYFSGEEQISLFEQFMAEEGCWSGYKMVTAFNLVRSNEFIWPYAINHYLRGNAKLALDSLYWSMDITHTPSGVYDFYLRQLLQNNALKDPDTITLADTKLNVRRLTHPSYFVALRDDNISPWQGVYASAQLFNAPRRFILVDTGHIAGIINPPTKHKHLYWTHDDLSLNAIQWREHAQSHRGSWWPNWAQWLQALSGKKISADRCNTAIEAAPGSYARG